MSIKRRHLFHNAYIRGVFAGVILWGLVFQIASYRTASGESRITNYTFNNFVGFDSHYTENDLSLTNNIDSISKIRSSDTWTPLNTAEKQKVLQDICNCEANYWGLDYMVSVGIDDLGENTLAYYSDCDRQIVIDKKHLERDAPEEILNTILHEMYHAWEHTLVRLYLDSNDSERRLRVFRHCKEYLQEISNYEDGEGTYESFLNYYCQYMEQDSREYAEANVEVYYAEIDNILETQKEEEGEGYE